MNIYTYEINERYDHHSYSNNLNDCNINNAKVMVQIPLKLDNFSGQKCNSLNCLKNAIVISFIHLKPFLQGKGLEMLCVGFTKLAENLLETK